MAALGGAGRSRRVPAPHDRPEGLLTCAQFVELCDRLGFRSDPEQRAVIVAPAGEDLHVVAGPGTGKTSSLVLRILKVVLVDGLRPSGIVATTFTVKAAAELRSRLLTRGFAVLEALAASPAPAVRIGAARIDVNQVVVNTIDGLCQTIMRDHREAGSVPPVVADDFAAQTLMLRVGLFGEGRFQDADLDAWLLALRGSRFGWNVGAKLGLLRTLWDRRFHDQVDWAAFLAEPGIPPALGDALAAYDAELRDRGLVDFVLLEQALLDRLSSGGLDSFTRPLQAVFVDEYQDTNLLQERLYLAMAARGSASLTVVGDDDQSLYRFRGATVDLFRDFPDRLSGALRRRRPQTHFLRRNYRSTERIVGFVNGYARLDPAFQAARVPGKPMLLPGSADAGSSAPILGLFRPDLATLASDLADIVAAVFARRGLRLPSGDVVAAARDGGDLGDAAMLCASPQENGMGKRRLPGLLRDELAARTPAIAMFNPRGEDFAAVTAVTEFGGLLLGVVDPDGGVEAGAAKALRAVGGAFASWRAAAAARLARDPALAAFHRAWVLRRPRRGTSWPRSTSVLKLVYGLLHFFPEVYDDPEGQVYFEVFTRQLAACGAIGTYGGDLLAPPATDAAIRASARELLISFLAPIASGAVGVDEDLIEAFPRDRLPVLSIHQAKGLEFPMVIVDVGSDFRTAHHTQEFKRFPRKGGLPHLLEDAMRRHSPLRPPARGGRDRAFDDLYRQFFVGFSRPEQVLLLVGLDGSAPTGLVPNAAAGWRRDGGHVWGEASPLVTI